MDYEQQFEGEESLMDNVEQAKSIISKIKFINKKIVEFQSSGLNTQKLVNQKKSLEHELMKKKVIVDSTAKDSELLTVWKTNCENMLNFIKDSSASEIDKAILDMKLTEASDVLISAIIPLQKTARRVGVLFRSVKELEFSNAQLAEENSFLKKRLSTNDKSFKELMKKAVNKLEEETDEEIASMITPGKGQKPSDVSRGVTQSNKLSMEMEMIENYQQTIHALDSENKELIGKLDSLEEDSEDLKEEVKTLEEKLKHEENKAARKASQIAHPMVKMETSDHDMHRTLTGFSTVSEKSDRMPSIPANTASFRGKNQINHKVRKESNAIVATITVQDGQEMEAIKAENSIMRMQMQKLKNALTAARKQKNRETGQNMATQTARQQTKIVPNTEKRVIEHKRRTPSPGNESQPVKKEKRVVKKFKTFTVKKRVVTKKIVMNVETNEEEEQEFSDVEETEEEEEVEEVEEVDEVEEEEEEEEAQPEEESYINDFMDDELSDEDFSDAPLDELVTLPQVSSPVKSAQPQESPKPTLAPVESPSDEELSQPKKAAPIPFKPVLPVREKKQRVKFDEPEEVEKEREPSPEAPEFRRVSVF